MAVVIASNLRKELAGGLRKGTTAGETPAATDAAGREVPGQLDALLW